jgi:co-chaperonin GroES (HSP10)
LKTTRKCTTAWSYAVLRRTSDGIIIPDTAKEKPQQGEVVAAATGARDEKGQIQPLDVKAGDRIVFGKWSGTDVISELRRQGFYSRSLGWLLD